jgi:hypothetical protein
MEMRTVLILGGAAAVGYWLYERNQAQAQAQAQTAIVPVAATPSATPAATSAASSPSTVAATAASVPPALNPSSTTPPSTAQKLAMPSTLADLSNAIQVLAANDANLVNGMMPAGNWNYYANNLLNTTLPPGWTTGDTPVTFAQYWASQSPTISVVTGLSGLYGHEYSAALRGLGFAGPPAPARSPYFRPRGARGVWA